MPDILAEIVEQTRLDISRRKRKISTADFRSFEFFDENRRDFRQALSSDAEVSIIAEVKKASPSKGIIRKDFDPVQIAEQYEENGAAAISILTDEPFFKGSVNYLSDIRKSVKIPLLRKDFIIDPYQIVEAKGYGADAILIIVRITNGHQLNELLEAADEAGIQCLVECYDEQDFNRLEFNRVDIVGVNNRDLENFEVHLHQGIELLKRAPAGVVRVSESGLNTVEDLRMLNDNGIHAALIGESLMRKPNPGQALKSLLK